MRFRTNESEKLAKYKKRLSQNMTFEEVILWQAIRNAQLGKWRIRRQVVIKHYIVDFACIPAKLIIEIDDSQHYEEQSLEYDIRRTNELNQLGFKVLRFTNYQIKNEFKNVLECIYFYLNSNAPYPLLRKVLPPQAGAELVTASGQITREFCK